MGPEDGDSERVKKITDSTLAAGRQIADTTVSESRKAAAGRAGAAATTAARTAGESAARRAKALVDRKQPEDPEVDQPDTSDN